MRTYALLMCLSLIFAAIPVLAQSRAGASAQNVSKAKSKAAVRHVSPLIARLSYKWATDIYNIQGLDNEEGNDELARTQMSAIKDQLQEAADFDLCKKTLACFNNDKALLDMVVQAATTVMNERNELSKAILETQVKHDDSASTADYNVKLTHMHDSDRCIKAIKSVAVLGFITPDDIARCAALTQ